MAHLALALLGSFQAAVDDQPVEGLNSSHLRALLAYLAVESRREHAREQVAALLWPERPDREALDALRFALSNLRGALGDRMSPGDRRTPDDHDATEGRPSPFPFLLVTRTHVQFNPASDHWLDLAEFQDLKNRSNLPGLERAARLYRGPFLEGLSLGDSPAFEEWMLLQGEEIQRSLLAVLERLTALQLSRGETGEARRWAQRQLELEPYREQAHRQLMIALALGGERSAALAHYEACCRLLADELGCEPEDETQALRAQIRDDALPQPQLIPRILSESPQPVIPGARKEHLTRFVARQGELAKLGSLLDQAMAGRGGVAFVSGEAGGGKTALLDELTRQAGQAHPDLIALRGKCNAHGSAGDPYLPFREILQTLAGDIESKRAGGTLSPEQARRAWEALPQVGAALVEHGPDLIDSFIPGEALLRRVESFSTPTLAARWQVQLREIAARSKEAASASRPDLFAQVTQVLHALSVRMPLLLTIDDLQWADVGTAALLFHLGRRLAGSRILLICAYRPEASKVGQESQAAEQGSAPGVGVVLRELVREWGDVLIDLDRADGQAFVEAYIDSEPNNLGEDFRQKLYDYTDGNPLFTVELLRSFERQGMLVQDETGSWVEAQGLDWDYCPPQVEAVIAGHLTELADEDQALLQAAAVQGEQFVAEVVARLLIRDEQAVVGRLSGALRTHHRLVQAVSLERLASTGQRLSHYRFRHSLIQRSAYGNLDVVERAQLHEATGRALEAVYAAEEDKPQGLALALAWHYEAAGLNLPAARALHDAGRLAMRLAAFKEALSLFDHGLTLLVGAPPSTERRELERLLEVARLGPQHNLAGSGGAELAGAVERAGEAGAGEAQGRPRLQFLLSEGQRLAARGQLQESLGMAQKLLDLATQWGDEAFIGAAHWRLGHLDNILGKLQEAEKHFDWLLAWLSPEWQAELIAANGYGLLPHVLSFSALNQWFLGHPEQALRRCNQAVAGEIERRDLYGQAFASAIGCNVLFLLRSEAAKLQERCELCLQHCQQQGFTMWGPYAEVFRGWLAVIQGQDSAGVARMQSAIAGWQAMGMAIGMDGLVMVLLDGCLAAARRRPAIGDPVRSSLLVTGLAAMEPFLGPNVSCGQSYQPELYRLKGELLLERDGLAAAGEALACFQNALQLGREMGALAWELRAAMSLVRLRVSQGEVCAAELAEARQFLSDLYARFTEGFSFPDLQEAATMISEAG